MQWQKSTTAILSALLLLTILTNFSFADQALAPKTGEVPGTGGSKVEVSGKVVKDPKSNKHKVTFTFKRASDDKGDAEITFNFCSMINEKPSKNPATSDKKYPKTHWKVKKTATGWEIVRDPDKPTVRHESKSHHFGCEEIKIKKGETKTLDKEFTSDENAFQSIYADFLKAGPIVGKDRIGKGDHITPEEKYGRETVSLWWAATRPLTECRPPSNSTGSVITPPGNMPSKHCYQGDAMWETGNLFTMADMSYSYPVVLKGNFSDTIPGMEITFNLVGHFEFDENEKSVLVNGEPHKFVADDSILEVEIPYTIPAELMTVDSLMINFEDVERVLGPHTEGREMVFHANVVGGPENILYDEGELMYYVTIRMIQDTLPPEISSTFTVDSVNRLHINAVLKDLVEPTFAHISYSVNEGEEISVPMIQNSIVNQHAEFELVLGPFESGDIIEYSAIGYDWADHENIESIKTVTIPGKPETSVSMIIALVIGIVAVIIGVIYLIYRSRR